MITAPDKTEISLECYREYTDSLLVGHSAPCLAVVSQLLDRGIALPPLYTDLFQRSLYEIGELWERNIISVATSHLATSITERVMSAAYPRLFAQPRCGRSAVISCAVNEYHQVGGRMVADALEMQGWDTWFLGANQRIDELRKFIANKKPDLVGLSASIYATLPILRETVDSLRKEFPQTPIIVGGQAFRLGGAALFELPQVTCIRTLVQLQEYLRGFPREQH